MYKHILSLLLILALLPSKGSAYVTIDLWDNTNDTIYKAGDVIKGLLSYTPDEEFNELRFGRSTKTYYSAGMSSGPFKIQSLSPAPDRRDIVFEFTVPFDFASNDTIFMFSARMYKSGQYYVQEGAELVKVRGISDIIAPTNDAKVKGFVDFRWYKVLGATAYQFQLTRNDDGNKPKVDPQAIITVLDTTVSTNSITVPMTFTGEHHWTVRAQVDGAWSEWVTPVVFTVEEIANVQQSYRESGIRLYPQPANSYVTIESTKGFVKRVMIHDLAGRMLLQTSNITGAPITGFNSSHLPPGLYQVTLTLENTEVTLPLIVK